MRELSRVTTLAGSILAFTLWAFTGSARAAVQVPAGEVAGAITVDTVWSDTSQAYVINNDRDSNVVVVQPGATLTIGAGVTVRSKYDNKGSLRVEGTLVAASAAFEMKTRDQVDQPIRVVGSGVATFTGCTFSVDRTSGTFAEHTGLLVVTDSGQLTLAGCTLNNSSSGATVNRAIWSSGGGVCALQSGGGGSRNAISGFPVGILCESTAGISVSHSDFTSGTYGIWVENDAVDVSVNASSFTDYQSALYLPDARDISLSGISITQSGAITDQYGVYTRDFNSCVLTAGGGSFISNMNIGVHASTDHSDLDVSQITFANNNWDFLAEGNWPYGTRISADLVLPVAHYHLGATVTVDPGVTLTIQPGTVMDLSDPYRDMFSVKGTIQAEGALFDSRIDNWTSFFVVTDSGHVEFRDCYFHGSDDYGSSGDSSFIELRGQATGLVSSCVFESDSSWVSPLKRGIWVYDNAALTVDNAARSATTFIGLQTGIFYESQEDLELDGCDFMACSTGLQSNTIANLFLYHLDFSGCSRGINLVDVGVLVTDDVNFVNTLHAFIIGWGMVDSPQISTAGMSFDDTSWIYLPGNTTITRNINLKALPYRFNTESGPVTIAEGFKMTAPEGARFSARQGFRYDLFTVLGEFVATGTHFDLFTHHDYTRSIRVQGNGKATFTQCTFSSEEYYSYSNRPSLLEVFENGRLTVRGCTFETSSDGNINTPIAIRVLNNAVSTIGEFDGQPTVFRGFDYAVVVDSIRTIPTFARTTDMSECGRGCWLNMKTQPSQYVTADMTISCPRLDINFESSSNEIYVNEGATLSFAPGSSVTFLYEDDWLIAVDGAVEAEDCRFEGYRLYDSDRMFYLRGNATGTFTDCEFVTSYAAGWSRCRTFELIDSATLTLNDCTLITDNPTGTPNAFGIKLSGNSRLALPAGSRSGTTFSGLPYAIHTTSLDCLTTIMGAQFDACTYELYLEGGASLTGHLTIPTGTDLRVNPSPGVTTIENGASLTLSPGSSLSNQGGDVTKNTFVVKGQVTAVDALVYMETRRYDYNYDGTRALIFAENGRGTFTNCVFQAVELHNNNGNGRLFELLGTSEVVIRGGSLQAVPHWDNATQYDYTRTAACVGGAASLRLEPYNGQGTIVATFERAIRLLSDQAECVLEGVTFRGNDVALDVDAIPSLYSIHGNTFVGNVPYAVRNNAAGELDCSFNYWGHPSGPYHVTNPFGLGDAVLGNVVFLPYEAQGEFSIAELTEHPVGQAGNAFTQAGSVADALLIRFQVIDGGAASLPCSQLDLAVKSRSGVENADMTNIRLYRDVDENGVLDARSDEMVSVGTADLGNGRIRFTGAFDLLGSFYVLADLAGIASGDALALAVEAGGVVLPPELFLAGMTSEARHELGRLLVANHPAGIPTAAFLAAPVQNDVVLMGFTLTGGYDIRGLDITLSGVSGITGDNISGVELLLDANSNGQEDFGETYVPAQSVTINGSSGTIHFNLGGMRLLSGGSYVLRADFSGLHRDDRLTLKLAASGVDAGELVTVLGTTRDITHTVPAPILILDSAFQVSNGFVASSVLNNLPLLGFTVIPGGRKLTSLSFPLWDVEGIAAADLVDPRIMLDINQNGRIDSGETTRLGGVGVVTIDPATGLGTITFDQGFTAVGGDYILMADVRGLGADDTLTIGLGAADVIVPVNDVIEGGVTPIRHSVTRSDLPTAARQTNWTLTYRSPGGNTVTGAFSHDDSKVILGYSSGTAYIFDAESNTPGLMLHRHYDKVRYAGFSADDSQAITVTYDGAVYVWNAESGDLENTLFSDLLVRYAIPSPDTTRLFIVTEGKGMLLDLQTGVTLWEFVIGSGTGSQLYAADYAPDGSKILVGAADKRAYLLDAETGVIIRHYQGHSQAVTGCTFAAAGNVILTSSTDGTATLWSINNSENPLYTYTLNDQQAIGAAVSRDGSRVTIVTRQSSTYRLRMFDDMGLEYWNTTLPYRHFTGVFSSMRFSEAGDRVLLCSDAHSDKNYPAALAVQYRVSNGSFLRFMGPRGRVRGWHIDQLYERPRVSEDGERIFYMHTEGLDVVFTEPGKTILEAPDLSGEDSFDVTPDGRKYVDVNNAILRYYSVDPDRMTLVAANSVGVHHQPLTLSRTGGLTIHGDLLIRTLSGTVFANSPNPDGGYRSAFSPDENLWGIAFYTDMSIKTMLKTDVTGSLEYGVTLTAPYRPVKILYHPDGIRVGCVDETLGVQFYRLDDNTPVGLYDYRSSGPRIADAALSHDGTMLAIARGNNVKLYDVRTGRVLRYFYPTHSDQANCLALSVGFGSHDNMMSIGWSDSYVEIFRRSRLMDLRLTPLTRTLPVGSSQNYQVHAVYDDGSTVDVTPEYLFRATGAELAPGARLYAEPPEAVTIEADRVTVNSGAAGNIHLTAVYSEGGYTRTAQATLKVGASPLVALFADPAQVTLSPGVVMPIRYRAAFADGYSEEVTGSVTVSTDMPERLRLAGNNMTVLGTAPPGDIQVTGTYVHQGVTRYATTTVSVHGPASRWERTVVTPGGDTHALAYSPNGSLLAVGSSSGAVTLYAVGLTPTQYEVVDVFPAHRRPVERLHFSSDSTLVSIGADGLIRQWNLNSRALEGAEYAHDAAITAAAFSGNLAVIGDNLGRVVLIDLSGNAAAWSRQLHSGEVTALGMDATSVISGGADRRVLLLTRSNGQQEMQYTAFAKAPVAVGFEGAQMYVLSGDKRLAKWDKGSEDGNLREFFFPALPTALTMKSNRTYVATAANGANATWVYDQNGLLLRWLDTPPNQGEISSLAVSPDGNYLLTGRRTGKITIETDFGPKEVLSSFHSCQFWDLNRGSYSGSLEHNHSLNDARISEDGSMLFTQSARRVFRWDIAETRGGTVTGQKFLETGYFAPYDFANLEVTGDDAGLVATRVRSSIYIMRAAERLLQKSVHTSCTRFGLSRDGTRMITNTVEYGQPQTWFWDIALDFPTIYHQNPVESYDVAYLDGYLSLGSVSGDQFVSLFNAEGLRYSGILIEDVEEGPEEGDVGSEISGPMVHLLTAAGNGSRVAVVVRYIEESMEGDVTSHNYLQVYQVDRTRSSGRETTSMRIFEVNLGTTEGIPPVAMALSGDGSLLFCGLSAEGKQGMLYDLNTQRELNRFMSPSAGTSSDLGPVAAQFTQNDAALMVAWTEGFAEIFHREGVDGLRLSPIARSVSAGESVSFTIEALYADGAAVDVSEKAILTVNPPAAATVDGPVVTISGSVGTGQSITVTAEYTELGATRQGQAVLTVQDAVFTVLSVDPPKIALARGQSVDLRFFAHFSGRSVEEVTASEDLGMNVSPAGLVTVAGTTVTVNAQAQYGDVAVTGRITREGDERSATMHLHITQPGSMVNPGDFDGSLRVDFNDLVYFIGHYGETTSSSTWDSRCDFDGNNKIDMADATAFVGLYNTNYSPTRSQPARTPSVQPAINLSLQVPAEAVEPGDVFEVRVFARENLPETCGFRGGPISVTFDPEKVAYDGAFDPAVIMQAPYNGLLTDGSLGDGLISGLSGLTVADGFGDGTHVLYAVLRFRALSEGTAAFALSACPESGLALTPPVGRVSIGDIDYGGTKTVTIDLGGGNDPGGALPVDVVYTLRQGWNMVGVPVLVAGRTEIPEGLTFYQWNGATYRPVDTLSPGRGYWVYAAEDIQLIITGFPVQPAPVILEKGWNLVAPAVETGNLVADSVLSLVFGWDAEVQAYIPQAEILREDDPRPFKPWSAYWVYAFDDGATIWEPEPAEPRR